MKRGPNYPRLHDLARHANHSSETLDVAVETLTSMLSQHERFSATEQSSVNLDPNISQQTRQNLRFQLQMLRSLAHRSKANESRLRNEIDLAFNLVAQQDTKMAVQISEAAQKNGAAMKTMAVLTLAFLPATFVSVCETYYLFPTLSANMLVGDTLQHELLQLLAR